MKFSTRTRPVHRSAATNFSLLSAAALVATCGSLVGCGGSEQSAYRRGPAVLPEESSSRQAAAAPHGSDRFWVEKDAYNALSQSASDSAPHGQSAYSDTAPVPIAYAEPLAQTPVRGTPVRAEHAGSQPMQYAQPSQAQYSQTQFSQAQFTESSSDHAAPTRTASRASAQIDPFAQAPGFGQRSERNPGEMTDRLEGLVHVTTATDGADFDPVVSRDGSVMVFASTRHRETSDIYLKQLGGNAVRQLTADPAQDAMPAISPDGSRVAFCSDRTGVWNIYVMSTTGGQAVQLTSTGAQDVHPSWSADGQRLVFSRLGERSGRWELWVMEVNHPTSAEFIGYGLFPEFCPQAGTGEHGSDKIVFQRSRERGDRGFSVWTLDYRPGDAGSPTEIAYKQGQALVNPTWSPDGEWIVYATIHNPANVAYAGTTAHEPTDLWMTKADGATRVNLTAGKFENLMPTWSPDGRIYFVSNREGPSNIWSIGTDKAIAAATGSGPASSNNHTAQANKMQETPHNTGHDDHNDGHGVTSVETDGHGHE